MPLERGTAGCPETVDAAVEAAREARAGGADTPSLWELERDRWPAPLGGETRLMATVRELRRKPLGGLTVEDMRLLIRQDVGLAYAPPLAVEVLRGDALAEGDMYEGDLLAAVWSGPVESLRTRWDRTWTLDSVGMVLAPRDCPRRHVLGAGFSPIA